ncbi:predicted protein [Verticillium alfalfae VaMs.102]|uniref:Predicted protein n=1 Tax=Verticillium alfalfae (strain VaMs.102 / ATCC MYA-4576 / FGSC 10136) TaxID=526221 RepID=C9SK71_VERA1|nr:predicted protein [Verticillium alfalfae VaMs.102]EEY19089.1 predicted protein [Verticillium alfalfae VaMs.102]
MAASPSATSPWRLPPTAPNFRGVNWPKVKDIMDQLGYTFTKSAMEQRWTKKILKDWRARVGPDSTTDESPPTSATPAKKRGRTKATVVADGDNLDTPSKKPKVQATGIETPMKKECTIDERDAEDERKNEIVEEDFMI